MNLASRKLAFVQAFLSLEDEQVILSFEQLLSEKLTKYIYSNDERMVKQRN